MAEKGPEGSVGDGVEGFVEVDVEVEGGGVGEREGLKMVDVVECLVSGASTILAGVQEMVIGGEGREKVGEVGGEDFVD